MSDDAGRRTGELPAVFADLPAGLLPVTVNFIAMDTRELLHSITITGPGAVVIPGFAPRKVAVETLFASGERLYEEPE